MSATVAGFRLGRPKTPYCAPGAATLGGAALDAATAAWSNASNVGPMFAYDLPPNALAVAEDWTLDTGQEGFWALSLATFTSCSTAAAVMRATAAKAAVLLEAAPTALGPFGFGIISAAPGDPACGVCQPLCFGGLDTKFIPGCTCHAFPCGKLLVLITAGGARGRTFAASGEPWMRPAMAAAVTAW